MRLRLGEILISRGIITPEQCTRILQAQAKTHRPFGVLAEELFDVSPRELQEAWAEQYECDAPRIDPRAERIDTKATALLNRRQAWQFRLLPVRFDERELLCCSTRAHLPRALNFAYRHMGPTCSFVLSDPDHLGEALQKHYPWIGPVELHGCDPQPFGAAATG
ncbi:MAG: hypothetical protein ACT4PL_04780 [Phycisphaerales bacterium]